MEFKIKTNAEAIEGLYPFYSISVVLLVTVAQCLHLEFDK
jgi:hypothetical protein